MSKVKKIPLTIFDDRVAETIKQNISAYLVTMWKFVYSDNILDSDENNKKEKNRSSTKTEELHEKFEEVLRDCFGNYKEEFNSYYSIKRESPKQTRIRSEQIDLFGKHFQVDMEMRENETNKLYSTILLKAPMTSIFKNRFNLIENMLGEALRALPPECLESEHNRVLFVTFMPNETYTLNKKKNNVKLEYSKHIGLYSSSNGVDTVLDLAAILKKAKDKISEIVIYYDFDFKNKSFDSIDDLKREISENDDFIKVDNKTIDYLRFYFYQFILENSHLEEFNEIAKYYETKEVLPGKPITIIDNPETKPQRRTRKKVTP